MRETVADKDPGTTPTGDTKLTRLDTKTLRRFIDHDVETFVLWLWTLQEASGRYLKTGDHYYTLDWTGVPSMSGLSAQLENPTQYNSKVTLLLGKLTAPGKGDGPMSAHDFLTFVKSAASELAVVVDDQKDFFDDVKRNLESVITTMTGAQQKNLDQIDSQKFLDLFRDVETDLTRSRKT
ncbi:type VII secretion system-associated protein [Streptomyces roseicoloratus]|uniref:Type VII secretion system-associated protein n=1 Tax=Streptomyces roseicoloratus TaxID=2508722 RepID=A0ABY9RS92_9ACTN|nr:type VII secretion system-associated protein [Streptomyces roseicoloratus]WMX43815.1 type VII secretion system-associated protein [Streptomyces roseicoloratus]